MEHRIILRKVGGVLTPLFRTGSGQLASGRPDPDVIAAFASPFAFAVLLVLLAAAWIFAHPLAPHAGAGLAMLGAAFVGRIEVTDAQAAAIKRVAPEFAPTLDAKTPAGIEGLRQARYRIGETLRGITDRAEAESRALTSDEATTHDTLLGIAKDYGQTIDVRSAAERASTLEPSRSHAGTDHAGRLSFVDTKTGRTMRTVRHGESIAAGYQPDALPDGIRAEELSIGRVVRAKVTGSWKGAEAEQRAMGTNFDTAGGFAVAEFLSRDVIDLARNQARVVQAGALSLPMPSSMVSFATLDADPTADWKAENAEATEDTSAVVGKIEMNAKALMGLLRVSRELVEDAPNLVDVVRGGLAAAIALKLDLAALRGDGVAKPTGVRNWPGIQTHDMGTNGGYLNGFDEFSKAWTLIQNVNGPSDGINVIYAPRTAGDVDLLKDGDGDPLRPPPSWQMMKKFATNQVPTNLTKGSATTASEAYVAPWDEMIIGIRTQITLDVSTQAMGSFEKAQVIIRAWMRASTMLRRANQFVLIDGILPMS